jgi:GNAT superfamily N-acetyltransferase
MARRSLRRVGTRDRADVIRMWLALFAAQQADGGLGGHVAVTGRLESEIGRWTDLLIKEEEHFGLVVARGEERLGFVAVTLRRCPWLTPSRSATIGALWVEPHVRRCGTGQQLVAGASVRLLKRGIDIIHLHALPLPHAAAQFWGRMGFASVTVLMQRQVNAIPIRHKTVERE